MVSTVQLKRSELGAGVFCVSICKFGHRQMLNPIALFEGDIRSEVCFYGAVRTFSMAVGLGMQGPLLSRLLVLMT